MDMTEGDTVFQEARVFREMGARMVRESRALVVMMMYTRLHTRWAATADCIEVEVRPNSGQFLFDAIEQERVSHVQKLKPEDLDILAFALFYAWSNVTIEEAVTFAQGEIDYLTEGEHWGWRDRIRRLILIFRHHQFDKSVRFDDIEQFAIVLADMARARCADRRLAQVMS